MSVKVQVRLEDHVEVICVHLCAALTAATASGGGEAAFIAPRSRPVVGDAGGAPLAGLLGVAPGFEGELVAGQGVFLRHVGSPKRAELRDADTATWLWTHAPTATAGLAAIRAAVCAAVDTHAPAHFLRAYGEAANKRLLHVVQNGALYRAVPVPPLAALHLADGPTERLAAAIAHARFMRSPEGQDAYARVGRARQVVVLITGPPGSGKSSVALQVAAAVGTELDVASTPAGLIGAPPGTVTLVDGVEKLENSPASALALQQVMASNHTTAANREAGTASTGILNAIEGPASPGGGAVLILTSSHPELLGPALVGRADHVIALDWATDGQAAAAFASRYPAAARDTARAFAAALRDALGPRTPVALGAVASFLTADRTPEQAVADAAALADETRRRCRLASEGSAGWWAHDVHAPRHQPKFPEGFLA